MAEPDKNRLASQSMTAEGPVDKGVTTKVNTAKGMAAKGGAAEARAACWRSIQRLNGQLVCWPRAMAEGVGQARWPRVGRLWARCPR